MRGTKPNQAHAHAEPAPRGAGGRGVVVVEKHESDGVDVKTGIGNRGVIALAFGITSEGRRGA